MSRARSDASGAVLLGLALVVGALSFLLSNGTVVVVSFGLALLGVVRIVRAKSSVPRLTTEEIDQLADRAGPSRGKQIVGESCAVCARSVMVAAEGAFCKKCQAPVHRACREAHDEAAHPVVPPGYR